MRNSGARQHATMSAPPAIIGREARFGLFSMSGYSTAVDGKPIPLEAGMVFTVEPGLYLTADDQRVPPKLRGIGVRIEDDVVMTESGFENLTASIPKQIDEVEAWMCE